MASRAGGLAKAPRVVPPPSGLLLWGLWLALCFPSAPEPPAVAVPSLWVTWGHLWLKGAMSSCLLPLQGQPPGVIWVQHKDSGSSQGTMTSLGGYRFCMGSASLCRGTVTVTRALQPLRTAVATMVPVCPHSAVPQELPTVAGCSWGSCSILALGWSWGATGGT